MIYGGYSFKVLTDLKVNGELYQRIVQGKDLVADILPPPEYVVEPYLVLMQLANTNDKAKRDKLLSEFDALKTGYEQRKQYWQKQTLEPKMRVAFQQVHDTGDSFFTTAVKEFIPAVQRSDATLITTALGKIEVAFDWHKNAVTGLVDLANKRALDDESLAKQSVSEANGLLLTVLLLTVAFGLSLAYFLIRSVQKQLGGDPTYAAEAVKQVAQGNFFSELKLQPDDSSSLIYDLKNLQKSVYGFMGALSEMSKNHADGWIFHEIEPKEFSGSFADMATGINQLVRSHIDVEMGLIDVIMHYSQGDFSVDMPRLPGEKAKICQAMDNVKRSLLDISTEIKTLSEQGCQGDFSHRSDSSRFKYLFKDILEDINLFIETCDSGFGDVERVTIAMAKGDLTQTITRDYPGKFGSVKTSVNATIENLREMVGNVKQASDVIYTAAKEISAGNNDLSHRTEQQAASLEETAAAWNN
ncbi:hypothetical protein [Methylocucumis oryzae]|uniref:hypothetical protein n=1 Tax=Methylocucumis oryzae TaxID=1632867 RepID=UPI000697DD87